MKQLITLFIFLLVAGCEINDGPDMDGPDGSWWVGGAYVYIEDDENTKDRIYQGVIYHVADETIWYKGKFDYSKLSLSDYSNSDNYDRWDGKRLYLKDNSFLKAIGPIPVK